VPDSVRKSETSPARSPGGELGISASRSSERLEF
jgi:hypothetical protein